MATQLCYASHRRDPMCRNRLPQRVRQEDLSPEGSAGRRKQASGSVLLLHCSHRPASHVLPWRPPEVLTVFLTSTRGHGNGVCGHASFKSVLPSLGRQRHGNSEFKAHLGYSASSRQVWAPKQNLSQEKTKQEMPQDGDSIISSRCSGCGAGGQGVGAAGQASIARNF